jgi:hypothetical protein
MWFIYCIVNIELISFFITWKAKPVVKRGRKATGPVEIAGLQLFGQLGFIYFA